MKDRSGEVTRTLAPRIVLGAVALVAGISLVELGLRILGEGPLEINPDQRHFWSYHPRLGWQSRAGAAGPFRTDLFDVHVSINSRGLRDQETSEHKAPGVRRVLVLGDSFSWGFGVDQDEIFSAVLEKQLSDTDVINAAVSGYSTDQSLLWLHDEGAQYEPDIVLYQLSGNDDTMNQMRRVYWIYYKPSFHLDPQNRLVLKGVPVPRASSTELMRHWLRTHSALARAVEALLVDHLILFLALAHPLPDPNDPHRLTLTLIDALRKTAARAGASFLVMTNSDFWYPGAGSYERLVSELRGAGHDVVVVEALPGWDAGSMQIPGDGHWNAAGHAFLAQALAEQLRSLPNQGAELAPPATGD